MAGIDPAPWFRKLAALEEWWLGALYAAATLPIILLSYSDLQFKDTPGSEWLGVAAVILLLAPTSILFIVVALYRDDDLLASGVTLAIITGLGWVIDMAITVTIRSRSLGPVLLAAPPVLFSLFVRALFLAPLFAGGVWLARRFRRFLAPGTVESKVDPNAHAE